MKWLGEADSRGPIRIHSTMQGPFLLHCQCLLLLLLGSLLDKSTKIINEDSFLKGFLTLEDMSQAFELLLIKHLFAS